LVSVYGGYTGEKFNTRENGKVSPAPPDFIIPEE
jgi:hypothetical protein